MVGLAKPTLPIVAISIEVGLVTSVSYIVGFEYRWSVLRQAAERKLYCERLMLETQQHIATVM